MVTGERCDGILGISSFKNYVLTIDFDTSTLVLARALKNQVKDNAMAVLLLPIKTRHVAVDAVLNNRHHIKLMIDSSDSASCISGMTTTGFAETFHQPSKQASSPRW